MCIVPFYSLGENCLKTSKREVDTCGQCHCVFTLVLKDYEITTKPIDTFQFSVHNMDD